MRYKEHTYMIKFDKDASRVVFWSGKYHKKNSDDVIPLEVNNYTHYNNHNTC